MQFLDYLPYGKGQGSSVSIVTRLRAGQLQFGFRQGQGRIFFFPLRHRRESSVGIALGYGLDDRGSRVRFPAGAGNFSLHHRVQTGSGAHPASYPMGARGSFLRGKAAGA
jgi:hypothetical protein